MLTKIINWIKYCSQWKNVHARSWDGMKKIENNNLTKFQNICFEYLKSKFLEAGLNLKDVEIKKMEGLEKISENYIYGILPNTDIEFYIYENGVQIKGVLSDEEWDFMTPRKMISNFVNTSINLSNNQPS